MELKKCKKCGISQHLDNYYVDNRNRKPFARCKDCFTVDYKSSSIKQHGSMEKANRYRWLKHKYKITPEKYNELFDRQGNVCPVCKRSPTELKGKYKSKSFPVDHAHRTGEIRGILCSSCNLALGKLEDDTGRVERLLLYLKGEL